MQQVSDLRDQTATKPKAVLSLHNHKTSSRPRLTGIETASFCFKALQLIASIKSTASCYPFYDSLAESKRVPISTRWRLKHAIELSVEDKSLEVNCKPPWVPPSLVFQVRR